MKKAMFFIFVLLIGTGLFLPAAFTEASLPNVSLEGNSPVRELAFSPDGAILASGHGESFYRSYNRSHGCSLYSVESTTLYEGTTRFWDMRSGNQISKFGNGYVYGLDFSPDGATFVRAEFSRYLSRTCSDWSPPMHTVRSSRSLKLLNTNTRETVTTLTGHNGDVNAVAFSPDGSLLASGGDDDTVRLWNPATGAHLHTLTGHSGNVNAVAFSPDGSLLASGGDDNTVRLWNPATGAHLHTLTGHNGDVNAVAFSPDGSLLASGSGDDTVRLWSSATGVHLHTLTGHSGDVNAVAFSPDGRTLASGGSDGRILLRRFRLIASVVSSLGEPTLDGSVVALKLIGLTYEADIAKIRNAVTVSGITGVTVNPSKVQRTSDTEITVALAFDGTDFDTDTALSFSVAAGALANYTGDDFTAEIPVTAVKESVAASVVSPLTEATLNENVVTLILTGVTYEQSLSKIRNAVTVSGITGVTVNPSKVQRTSDTEITVALAFDGTDFDTDTALSFSVAAGALANYTGDDFTAEIPVTAIVEVVSASVVSPLTEETLDGSIVTLKLTGIDYEQDISKISDAVTVSGIDGVTIDTTSVQRLGDQIVSVELDYDDTDFVRDSALTFSVADGAITTYKGPALTTEVPVTASRGEGLLTIFWTDSRTDKIQRANLDGSDVQKTVESQYNQYVSPIGIALDMAGGKMYWTYNSRTSAHSADKIQRANLDGSNVEDLVTIRLDGVQSLDGIALDVVGWQDVLDRF